MFTKILFINSLNNDFLADSFLIGLKKLFPENVFEYPVNKYIYNQAITETKMHGIGFTLYHSLDIKSAKSIDISTDLSDIDLFIFGDIYREWQIFKQIEKYLHYNNTIILDGEDTPAIFPYYFAPWKKPIYPFFFPKIHQSFHYFKREIIPSRTNYYRFYKLLPAAISKNIAIPKNVFTISFSIPDDKIVTIIPPKTKTFPKHIVDEEVCKNVEGSVTKYAFDNEKDYYKDLQNSKFGITTKRGGWDCLRHYEIAANGAVICFKNLNQKHHLCAPHGLIPDFNCIDYSSYDDLMNKVNSISGSDYQTLLHNSLNWIQQQKASTIASNTIEQFLKKINL